MRRNLDKIINAIFRETVKQWPIFDTNELEDIPNSLSLNVFPCYRQTLNSITENCFSLPRVLF